MELGAHKAQKTDEDSRLPGGGEGDPTPEMEGVFSFFWGEEKSLRFALWEIEVSGMGAFAFPFSVHTQRQRVGASCFYRPFKEHLQAKSPCNSEGGLNKANLWCVVSRVWVRSTPNTQRGVFGMPSPFASTWQLWLPSVPVNLILSPMPN